jgi:choice-of-anchor B domain-containing protein
MKKTFLFLFILGIFTLFYSCSSEDITREIVTIEDELDPNDPNDPDPDDPDDPDPDPEPQEIEGFMACDGGFAGIYPCWDYDLISHIPLNIFGATKANDCWGWTDPQTGREYAIIGFNNGTGFVDVTDTENIIYVGKMPITTSTSDWRDIKVYNNFAFLVSESPGYGMRVFNLAKLRDVEETPAFFATDYYYSEFDQAHNIAINEDTGYAYVVGSGTYSGGPHFINIQSPLNPIHEGGFNGGGYSHDAQVVTYNGPDSDYTGREIYIGSNVYGIVIVDVTDKSNPELISTQSYPNVGYSHQGWLTEDHRYFLAGDEFDELDYGVNTRTLIMDFEDLDNPILMSEYNAPSFAIDHNGYTKGDLFYLASYTAGLRIIDISSIETGSLEEVGYFDSFPTNNATEFNGAWSVYPYFDSGKIIISDINNGLFIVQKKP